MTKNDIEKNLNKIISKYSGCPNNKDTQGKIRKDMNDYFSKITDKIIRNKLRSLQKVGYHE